MWFTYVNLAVERGKRMDYRVFDLATKLKTFDTADQTWAAVSDFFKSEGFMLASHGYFPADIFSVNSHPLTSANSKDVLSDFGKGSGRIITPKPPISPVSPPANPDMSGSIRVEGSAATAEFYRERGPKYDPIFYKSTVGLKSYLTGPDFVHKDQFGNEYFNFMKEVKAQGFTCGFVTPLMDIKTGGMGRFMVGASFSQQDATNIFKERQVIYELIMYLADEYLRLLPDQSEIEAIGLTDREIECLLWLTKGMRADRIADCIGISSATVNLHFANLKRKLKATTREQALVKAIRYRIIKP